MHHKKPQILLFFVLLFLSLPVMALADHKLELPSNPKDICPLLIGNAVPAVNLQTIEGKSIRLNDQVNNKPTILIFYRGGW
jgi:hypothetical protein